MSCMKRTPVILALLLFLTGTVGAGKPRKFIDWAASWDDAVAEAQALNMPIVVHRHGFY